MEIGRDFFTRNDGVATGSPCPRAQWAEPQNHRTVDFITQIWKKWSAGQA